VTGRYSRRITIPWYDMTTVSEIFETMAYGPAPESDKPALEWIARQSGAFGLFIGGR